MTVAQMNTKKYHIVAVDVSFLAYNLVQIHIQYEACVVFMDSQRTMNDTLPTGHRTIDAISEHGRK